MYLPETNVNYTLDYEVISGFYGSGIIGLLCKESGEPCHFLCISYAALFEMKNPAQISSCSLKIHASDILCKAFYILRAFAKLNNKWRTFFLF
jgi:hypothetical protein